MILQEEAMNLLTRKIVEAEEALKKQAEEKEILRREKEVMAKEIFRLKSAVPGEDLTGEYFEKTEKLRCETPGSRPYRLIKELKAKIEEQDKSISAWKSKQVSFLYIFF